MKELLTFCLFFAVLSIAAQTSLLLPIYEGENMIVFYDEDFEELFRVENQKLVYQPLYVNDRIICQDKNNKKRYTIYTETGTIIFQSNQVNYYWLHGFQDGICGIRVGNDKAKKTDWIDKDGNFIQLFEEFEIMTTFSEGFAFYTNAKRAGKISKCGIIKVDETPMTACKFNFENLADYVSFPPTSATVFSENLCPYRDSATGMIGYLDTFGRFSILPQFSTAKSFSEGLGLVRLGTNADDEGLISKTTGLPINGNHYGFIDKTGEFVIEPKYTHATSFSDEIAIVKDTISRYMGGIDRNENTIIPFEYKQIQPFQFGMAAALPANKTKQVLINKNNEILYENQGYSSLLPISETIIYEDFRESKHRNQYINIKTGAILKSKDMMREIGDLDYLKWHLPSEIASANLPKRDTIFYAIPGVIRSLVNLRKLNVTGHKITEIPSWIGDLEKLKELNVRNNPIQSLPKNIGNLIHLESIDLTNTNIEKLPRSFYRLSNLQTIKITEQKSKRSRKTIAKIQQKFPEANVQISQRLEGVMEELEPKFNGD